MLDNFEEILSSPILKRSIRIAGHNTSISLEKVFLDELMSIANKEGRSFNDLVLKIDEIRSVSLSSACRLYVLANLLDHNSN